MIYLISSKYLLAASSQDLKRGLEYLDHPLVQDIKETGRVSISAEGIEVD
jgi:hypothetical protein